MNRVMTTMVSELQTAAMRGLGSLATVIAGTYRYNKVSDGCGGYVCGDAAGNRDTSCKGLLEELQGHESWLSLWPPEPTFCAGAWSEARPMEQH